MTDPYDGRPADRDDELRALFEDAVSDVDPPPALHHIQARTSKKVTPMNSKRPWIFAAIGAVAATAATLVAVTVITDEDPRETAGPAGSPSASATPSESTEPSEDASAPTKPTPAPSKEPAPTDGTYLAPVYYVGDTPAGPRLYREFHVSQKEGTTAVQVQSALSQSVSMPANDPDYRSDWPAGTKVVGVNIDGTDADDVVWIDLSGAALRERPAGMSQEEAEIAVEQLIYTAQGVLQQRQPIQLMIDGERTDMVLGVPTSEPLAAGDPMAVQASVWIIDPQNGDTVGRTFTVEGRGAFFEANVSWQLLKGGQVVQDGFTTAEEGMTLSPYSFEVTAEPGQYVLRVYDADMSGGEGNGEAEDTKAIFVE